MWEKIDNYRWRSNSGDQIIKYRMAGRYYYLLYLAGESLDGGDYTTYESLKSAKLAI